MLHLLPLEDPPAATRTFFCPASRANILADACRSLTGAYRPNQQYCCQTRCRSPWRLCILYIAQGYTDEDAQVTNSEKGWCTFHTEQGATAARPKNYYCPTAAYCESYPIRYATEEEKHRIPGSSGRTGGDMHLPHTGGGRHKTATPPMVIPVDIQDVANKIKRLPQEKQRKLVEQLGQFPQKTMEDIARDLNIQRNSLDSLFRHVYTGLGMPGRQYSVAEKREVVHRAWQLAYPAE